MSNYYEDLAGDPEPPSADKLYSTYEEYRAERAKVLAEDEEREWDWLRLGPFMPDYTAEAWAEVHAAQVKKRADWEQREAVRVVARQERRRKQWVEAGVPSRLVEVIESGEGLDETRALSIARSQTSGILVLSGPRGVGKTLAAVWWLMRTDFPDPRFVTPERRRFLDAPALARWPRYDDAKMTELERARALVIDDIGLEYDDTKGAFRSLFDALVNARYAADLPTCVTTNLTADEFKLRYGERVADRIRETGRFAALVGDSLRRKDSE